MEAEALPHVYRFSVDILIQGEVKQSLLTVALAYAHLPTLQAIHAVRESPHAAQRMEQKEAYQNAAQTEKLKTIGTSPTKEV